MLVSTKDGKTFTLTRENATDHQLLDALDSASHIYKKSMVRAPSDDGRGGQQNLSALLGTDWASKEALWAQSGSEALHALRQVFRLGLGDSTDELSARLARIEFNLQAHEQLAPSLVKLNAMLESLALVVSKQEAVVDKLVRAHSEILANGEVAIVTVAEPSPAEQSTTPPAPGQPWPAQGGTYIGIAPAEGNLPARHLVVLDGEPDDELDWADAVKWAEAIGNGARLPTQLEALFAYTVAKSAFKPAWHWTLTQDDRYNAFYQSFEYGTSGWYYKDYELRVRACRGLALHIFTPLTDAPTHTSDA